MIKGRLIRLPDENLECGSFAPALLKPACWRGCDVGDRSPSEARYHRHLSPQGGSKLPQSADPKGPKREQAPALQTHSQQGALRLVVELCHPDVAGYLTQVEHNLVGCDCNIHQAVTNIQDRAPYLVDVVEGQRRSHGPLGFWLHGLRPKAGKAIAVRDKVDAVSIRRPARFVVPVLVADDPDPVALFRRSITLKGRDQHLQARRRSLPVQGVKSNPAAIVSECGVTQQELGRLKIIASLAEWQG